MNLNGKWSGYYEYGPGYFYPFFGSRVDFEINFILNNQGSFKGSIQEIPSQFSVPIEAEVKGFVDNDFISFVKSYKVRPEISEDGKSIIIKDGILEISFTGYIDKENACIYGAWDLEEPFTENGETFIDYLSGIWMIKKES